MVYAAILEAEQRDRRIGTVEIQRNKTILSKSRTPAEIDIYWEYTLAGIKHAVAIECKNYRKKVGLPQVRDFARKISDVSGLKGLIVSHTGYSENAILEASGDNIDLLVVRPQVEQDWEGRFKQVDVALKLSPPAMAKTVIPRINAQWARENGFQKGDQIQISCSNNELIFKEEGEGFEASLFDLEENFTMKGCTPGQYKWERSFDNGWMVVATKKYKIDHVVIDYSVPDMIETDFSVDFTQYVLGVMEFINGDQKKFLVLKDGVRNELD
ncbi:restriction endonuclease [Thalassospira sp. ER-Se-21-Dark]|uniref:restriction endonuclease n=1 Tax=Thalassospira sp. ER-Se-21-Dark TaxID=2585190 RepID=UPI001B30E7D2|nr:restriction endonuclease [Thalassospira sp. ER-Se-21-Dark]